MGPLVGFMGFHGAFWGPKKTPQQQSCSVEGFFGAMLGQCWAVLGPSWALLGALAGYSVWVHGGPVEVLFGSFSIFQRYVGTLQRD